MPKSIEGSKSGPPKDPLGTVNATGFALQLAVEEFVRKTSDRHDWTVTSREHGWHDGENGVKFIDLVLTQGAMHLVIECKRLKDTRWVFLVPDPPMGRGAEMRRHCRLPYLRNLNTHDGRRAVISLENFQLDPTAWESSFCSVSGASDRDHPLLDRICAELTRSTDAILSQQLTIDGRHDLNNMLLAEDGRTWTAIPAIVTTADLYVCLFDPGAVPPDRGEIAERAGRFERVTAVRYRKSFDMPGQTEVDTLSELERYAQRTVTILSASYLTEWLKEFNLIRATYRAHAKGTDGGL